jgi:hypothetical protein
MCDLLKNILAGLISSGIYTILFFVWRKISIRFNKKDPRITSTIFYILILFWVVSGILIYYYVIFLNRSFFWLIISHLLWSFFIILYLTLRWKQFRNVGIYGVDLEIKKGIDYQKSLLLVNNKIKFLGIGASKLTDQRDAFKKALKNCVKENSIKFLLCKPDHNLLLKAAKRFEKPLNTYKNNVINSLRYISDLKGTYENIEVRFYNDFQIFRMMFIDDSICLFSYNVMGEGDGSQLPQIHIVKHPKRDVNSLYYPLERYFDDLWKVSEEWDFKEFLNN